MIRLVDHLLAQGLSRREVRDGLEWGRVWVRGCPTALAARWVEPAEVEYRPGAPRHRVGAEPCVLFEGRGFLVLLKPAGILSVPARRRRAGDLMSWAAKRHGASWVVHRLDEGTSGLMLMATHEEEHRRLKEAVHRREVERRYLAIVRGGFPERLTVRSSIVKNRGDGRRGSGEGGLEAITHFRRLERLRGATLVEAKLETGRRHQVRIHLAERGQPVLGDTVYGRRGEPLEVRGRPRIALHAWKIGFVRPDTGEPARFEALLADDLESLRRKLGGDPGWRPF